jgi:hypothetical protein
LQKVSGLRDSYAKIIEMLKLYLEVLRLKLQQVTAAIARRGQKMKVPVSDV